MHLHRGTLVVAGARVLALAVVVALVDSPRLALQVHPVLAIRVLVHAPVCKPVFDVISTAWSSYVNGQKEREFNRAIQNMPEMLPPSSSSCLGRTCVYFHVPKRYGYVP